MVSIDVVNTWGSVLLTGHLYNAVRQEQSKLGIENYQSVRWADMDSMMEMLGTESLFLGDPPKTPNGYYRHYSMAGGLSVSNFARNRRKLPPVLSEKGKNIGDMASVSYMFKERFIKAENFTPRYDLGLDDVEKILSKARRVP